MILSFSFGSLGELVELELGFVELDIGWLLVEMVVDSDELMKREIFSNAFDIHIYNINKNWF